MSGNVYVRLGSETRCVADWSRLRGINVKTARKRMQLGWPNEKVFS
jgi:hypothetical protein